MPVAIRIPLAGLLVGGSTGVRIATGLATLAMTCGSLNCCVFARVPFETAQCTAQTVREAGPYISDPLGTVGAVNAGDYDKNIFKNKNNSY